MPTLKALISDDEVSHSSNSPGYLLVRYINHLRLVALSSITETDQQGETQEASWRQQKSNNWHASGKKTTHFHKSRSKRIGTSQVQNGGLFTASHRISRRTRVVALALLIQVLDHIRGAVDAGAVELPAEVGRRKRVRRATQCHRAARRGRRGSRDRYVIWSNFAKSQEEMIIFDSAHPVLWLSHAIDTKTATAVQSKTGVGKLKILGLGFQIRVLDLGWVSKLGF